MSCVSSTHYEVLSPADVATVLADTAPDGLQLIHLALDTFLSQYDRLVRLALLDSGLTDTSGCQGFPPPR